MSDFGLSFVKAAEEPKTANFLLFGPPKCGKTTASFSAPGPIMVLNLEGGGALGFARKIAAERGTDVHEIRPDRADHLRPILLQIVEHVRSGAHPQVQSVVVDTIGKVREQLARNIGGDQPKIAHWADVDKIIVGFVQAMRDSPVNLILLAHEDIKDADDGDRIVEPLIGGKTTAKVCGEVDVLSYVARVEDEDGTRWMGQLVPSKGRRAGDRSNGLGKARELDLTEWLATYTAALRPTPQDATEASLFPDERAA